jgi:hypothetical protein
MSGKYCGVPDVVKQVSKVGMNSSLVRSVFHISGRSCEGAVLRGEEGERSV